MRKWPQFIAARFQFNTHLITPISHAPNQPLGRNWNVNEFAAGLSLSFSAQRIYASTPQCDPLFIARSSFALGVVLEDMSLIHTDVAHHFGLTYGNHKRNTNRSYKLGMEYTIGRAVTLTYIALVNTSINL